MEASVCQVLRDPAWAKQDRKAVIIWALLTLAVVALLHGTAIGEVARQCWERPALSTGSLIVAVVAIILLVLQSTGPVCYFFLTERLAPLREAPPWSVVPIFVICGPVMFLSWIMFLP